jgi:hypothetical protein
MSKWIGGLAEWQEGDTTFLSIAFTWKLDEAYSRAVFAKACGRRVIAGGVPLHLVRRVGLRRAGRTWARGLRAVLRYFNGD